MNKFVSQKIRLIPTPHEVCAHSRRPVHHPKDLCPNRTALAKGLRVVGYRSRPNSSRDTNSGVRHNQEPYLSFQEQFWLLRGLDGSYPHGETSAGVQAQSRKGFCIEPDLEGDLPRSVEGHERIRPGAKAGSTFPSLPVRESLPPKSPLVRDVHDEVRP